MSNLKNVKRMLEVTRPPPSDDSEIYITIGSEKLFN